MKKKLIFIGLVFLFLFSVPFMFQDSNSILIKNPKLGTSPNFEAISGSEYATRWVLSNTSAFEDFHDDIASGYWDLYSVGERYFYALADAITDDAYTSEYYDVTNFGDDDLRIWRGDSGYNEDTRYTYVKYDTTFTGVYLNDNTTGLEDNDLYLYCYYSYNPTVSVYRTTNFDESTIKWSNQPDAGALQSTFVATLNSWNVIDLGTTYAYYTLRVEPYHGSTIQASFHSMEWGGGNPRIRYHRAKNYYGGGYAYMQTGTTEIVGLISPTYGSTYNLSAGDYFKINCKPMTSNKIELKLYKNDIIQKTITVVPQDNTNYNTRDIEVFVDEYVEFDQILFTGTLEDTKYFKVFDIKTYKYESTGVSFYLAPYERRAFSIFEDDYTLKIYELDALKVEKDITITSSLHTEIYSPIGTIECRLSLFSQENDPLDFCLFHINITRTLNNNTDTYPLLNNIFLTDIEKMVYIYIYDRFDNSIKNDSMVARSFIDIVIDIYSLKIKNEYENYVPYALKNNDTDVVKSGNIFSDEIVEFLMGSGIYIFNYSKNDDDYSVVINFNDNQILVINSSKICLLSYANQRGEYLFFYNYKTYINGSLIYRNDIYKEIGDNVSIEVKDRYDISIKNESFIVNITDNYFSIILTEYSLKVCNQQEKFNHINITRDPNYYESENYWSEWMAPNEIIKFYLFPGYYKINVTNVEDESYSYYSYTFNGDDMLLLTSDNTIANAIINIQNVNTTIGNQITNVEINITNQNSAINNTVVNIEINLENVNSTIGDLLLSQNIQITNIENNLTSMYVFTNTSFINLNSSIDTYFVNIENNIISINQSISNLVIGIDNNLALINGTISTLIVDIGNDLMIMNTSIYTSFFFLNTTIAEIGSNITTNTILLNNSIFLTGNWINDSRIAILNNLALINNTIMTGINQIYTSVYLINNSIYTAVIDLGTSLTLENNKITGNLSIILQQNDFLTAIYNKTMFSELLNWSGVGYNFSIMEDRIDVFKFINEYKSQSVEILLKYQDKVESMILSAQNSLNQWLPKENVEYRLKSVATGKYLTDWEEMPEDKTVSFGFYETEIPAEPEPIDVTVLTVFIFFLFVSVIISIVLGVFVYLQSEQIKTLKLYRKLKRSGII